MKNNKNEFFLMVFLFSLQNFIIYARWLLASVPEEVNLHKPVEENFDNLKLPFLKLMIQ